MAFYGGSGAFCHAYDFRGLISITTIFALFWLEPASADTTYVYSNGSFFGSVTLDFDTTDYTGTIEFFFNPRIKDLEFGVTTLSALQGQVTYLATLDQIGFFGGTSLFFDSGQLSAEISTRDLAVEFSRRLPHSERLFRPAQPAGRRFRELLPRLQSALPLPVQQAYGAMESRRGAEPRTLPGMMLAGAGLLGWWRRRRKAAQA